MSIVFADRSLLSNYLTTTLGLTSSCVEDALYAWFGDQGYTDGALVDRELLWLAGNGFTTGSIDDRWYAYLKDRGFTSPSLPDLFREALEAGTLLGFSYTLLAALNASNTNPLTALTGTNLTQTATSPVVVPDSTGTLITIAAGQPAIPGAVYSGGNWSAPESATAQVLASGLTRYTGGPSYNPGLGVLAEPAATNLAGYGTVLSNAYWGKTNVSVADDALASPHASYPFDKIKVTTTDGAHGIAKPSLTTSGVYTVSAVVKAGEITWCMLGNSQTGGVYFNLATGAEGTNNTGFTGTITPLSDGAHFITATYTHAASTGFGLYAANGDTVISFAGANTTDGFYATMLQCEQGSVATSPAVTTGAAAVTRGPRYTPLTGSELGSKIMLDATPYELGREQYLLGGTTGKVYQGADNKIYATDGTTTLVSTSLMVANTTAIIGVDFAGGKLYINGTQEDSDVALNPTWGAAPNLGATSAGGSVFNGTLSVLQSSSDAGFSAGSTN